MKLKIFLLLLLSLSAYAQNLHDILSALGNSGAVKYIKEKRDSEIAANELSLAYNAPELGLSLAHAKDSAQDGIEYSFSLSQNIAQPFSSADKNSATEFAAKSLKQGAMHDIHMMTLDVASKYHSACVAKEMGESSDLLFTEQNKRFSQIQKAYDLGEISKKELLFNKLDLAKLSQKASAYKREYLSEFSSLQKELDSLILDGLSCDDLVVPIGHVELGDINAHDELIDLAYQQKSSQAFYAVYDSTVSGLGYELAYDKELDTRRYTAGITIPLSFLSSQKEREKAKYLHNTSALNAYRDSLSKKIQSASKALQQKIKTLFDEYTLLQTEIVPLNEELLKLSKSALDEGEGTVMEYLDASRSYSENVLEMLAMKKTYYYELFELYKTADLEFGE
ncbi:TolC family protein [bacterium]|nr:TolC family protein [bacterium]MBU1989781.1 TolC family protein [bacterium]